MTAKGNDTAHELRGKKTQEANKGEKDATDYKIEDKENAPETEEMQKSSHQAQSKQNKEEPQDCANHWEDAVRIKKGQDEYKKFKDGAKHGKSTNHEKTEEEIEGSSSGSEGSTSRKRGRGANQSGANKKPKQKGSSEQKAIGPAGDKTRVPKVGQKVQWKALPGLVDGEAVEVVYEEKEVEGKQIKASSEDPRIVLKSASSGKIAVHKPEAVYFE